MKPKHVECNLNCKNLYQCTFTCHGCRHRLPNGNRCDEHKFNHEDSVRLNCSECLQKRNYNIKCSRHQLKLGEIDLNPQGENCEECKKLIDTYSDSDSHQVYSIGNLSACEECADDDE